MVNLDNFFHLLKKSGISAKKLSSDTGISSGNISDWKSGRSMPTATKLVQLADYFKCSVDYLLGRTNDCNISSDTTHSITNHEQELLNAYRKNKEMQTAVDKLLGIDSQRMRAIKIARSNNSKVTEITGDFSDIINAPCLEDDDL